MTSVHTLHDLADVDTIFTLYRADTSFLGFMPRGGFEQAASDGRLLIARDESNQIAGYLLYRVAKGRASITHLCVSRANRKSGVARQLVNILKTKTQALEGILVKCRREYPATAMWPLLGFKAIGEQVGRGKDQGCVVLWYIDNGHVDLFSGAPSDKTQVALDANVFFDIVYQNRENHESSSGLLELILP